jgi:hypothetical protein
MKAQISVFAAALALAPVTLVAQPTPPWDLTEITSSSVESEMTLVSAPSPFEAEPESVSCATAPVIAFKADANETSPEITDRYARAHGLIIKGAWQRAQLVLERGIEKFPQSRHLRMLYSDLLWYRSRGGQNQALLEQSAQEAVRAMEIGLGFETVDYRLIDRLSQTLGRTGDAETFERLFTQILALDAGPVPNRHYALGLSRMGSPRTEDAFKAAISLEAEGDAHVDFGEWLLDRSRHADVLEMLPKAPKQIYYLHFLRALALERSGRPAMARSAYNSFLDFSGSFPAPARFRIHGSKLQSETGIHFDDETGTRRTTGTGGISNVTETLTDQEGIRGLSYLIWGEARGENYGGMLAEGWVVRARVLRGNVADPLTCPAVTRTGTTLADWYKSVMCQSGAFDGVCSAWCSNTATTACTSTASTDSAAYDVFYGTRADPVSGHCPGGVTANGDVCTGAKTCVGSVYTYKLASPLFNLGISASSSCQTHSCAPNNYGKVCANGGTLENCFYGNSACAGAKRYGYNGTISAVGGASVSPAYYVSTSGTHRGHLEGPETGVNFNLYLQQSSTGTDPWTNVAQNPQPSAVEDVDFTTTATAYYRWRVVSVTGTGSFTLCTRRP